MFCFIFCYQTKQYVLSILLIVLKLFHIIFDQFSNLNTQVCSPNFFIFQPFYKNVKNLLDLTFLLFTTLGQHIGTTLKILHKFGNRQFMIKIPTIEHVHGCSIILPGNIRAKYQFWYRSLPIFTHCIFSVGKFIRNIFYLLSKGG